MTVKKNSHLKLRLLRSTIKCTKEQTSTIRGLGLKKIGDESKVLNVPTNRGMVKKMINWLEVKE
ncbi:MAG: 50S ribosomal protein L30 [Bacteriovoracaceae bacterium]|nr:50S ribosomal protein L30 [Bacteriovoracaceae bacterium]